MCARGNPCRVLSSGILLILLLCTCAVAMHFIAESLAPGIAMPGYEQDLRLGHANNIHEHGEDLFVFPSLNCASIKCAIAHVAAPILSNTTTISLSPQLPPPNHTIHNG